MSSFLGHDISGNYPPGAGDQTGWYPFTSPCQTSTTTNMGGTFNASNGTLGTGAFTGAPKTIDGHTLKVGDRVLLKNQTTATQNGVYIVTTVGASTTAMERDDSFGTDQQINQNIYTRVLGGSTNVGKAYIHALGSSRLVLNTDNITYSEANPPKKPYVQQRA